VGGAQVLVHNDLPAGPDGDPDSVQLKLVGDRTSPGRYQEPLGRNADGRAAGLDRGEDAGIVRLDLRQVGRCQDLDVLCLEGLEERGGDNGILERCDSVRHFDDGDLGAQSGEQLCLLQADGVGPEDNDRCGQLSCGH
jgi:hypothetical protein